MHDWVLYCAALVLTWKRFAITVSSIWVPETRMEIGVCSCVLQLDAAKRASDKATVCQVFLLFQGLYKGTFLVYPLLLSSKQIFLEVTTNNGVTP